MRWSLCKVWSQTQPGRARLMGTISAWTTMQKIQRWTSAEVKRRALAQPSADCTRHADHTTVRNREKGLLVTSESLVVFNLNIDLNIVSSVDFVLSHFLVENKVNLDWYRLFRAGATANVFPQHSSTLIVGVSAHGLLTKGATLVNNSV